MARALTVTKVIRCRDCGAHFTGHHNRRFCDRDRYLRRIATYGRVNQRRGRVPSPKGRFSGPPGWPDELCVCEPCLIALGVHRTVRARGLWHHIIKAHGLTLKELRRSYPGTAARISWWKPQGEYRRALRGRMQIVRSQPAVAKSTVPSPKVTELGPANAREMAWTRPEKLFHKHLNEALSERVERVLREVNEWPCSKIDQLTDAKVAELASQQSIPIPEFDPMPKTAKFESDSMQRVTYVHAIKNGSSLDFYGSTSDQGYKASTFSRTGQELSITFEPMHRGGAKTEHKTRADAIKSNVEVLQREIPSVNDAIASRAKVAANQRREHCERYEKESGNLL